MTYQLFFMLCVKDNLDPDESIVPPGTVIIMRVDGSINSFKWPYAVETLQTPTQGSWFSCGEAGYNTN